ncbi:amidase [Microbacterium sp. RD1]|uniref:amidase n=1 Tax=Microbacterium sp. RD1 TaxID=3457313 RepID=UPI003FA5A1C6
MTVRDVSSVVAAVHRREVSVRDLVEESLARIDQVEPAVNALITITDAQARAQAGLLDRSTSDQLRAMPLAGITVAVKDNIDTADAPTTSGSGSLRGNRPPQDATTVRRLREAGAVVVGKANLHEFGWGGSTENPHYGPTRNPWDLSRNAGGSSGGSAAAVAAGECVVALGTDTGGSIRLPSAMTGMTGLRPSVGRVSLHGVFPLAWTMDTVGPIARTAEDVAAVHRVIAGYDPKDPGSSRRPVPPSRGDDDLRGKRVGVIRGITFERAEPGIAAALRRAVDDLANAGAVIVELEVPGLDAYYDAWLIIHVAEPSAVHRSLLSERRDAYGPDVRALLLAGESVTASDYLLAQRYRRYLRQRFEEIFARVDGFLLPGFATTAATIGADPADVVRAFVLPEGPQRFFTGLASVLGSPALALPIGFVDRLPAGMQIVGRPFDEEGILSLGIAYQQITAWHAAVAPVQPR